MLGKIGPKLYALVINIKNKITFLPTLISLGAFLLGVAVITFRNAEIESFLFHTPLVKIHEIETLRSILTAFLTGLISITIFSFSMMMLVLSQVANQYSPKILNWMVGKRSNQYVLGVYLGTIIFTILLLIQLPETSELKPLYHFAIVIDAGLTFYCLTLFVTFINHISNDIQISNIIEKIYQKTCKKLKQEVKRNNTKEIHDPPQLNWIEYNSEQSGYLQKITQDDLLKLLVKNNLKIKIVQNFGYYHIKGNVLYSLDKEIKDKKLLDAIRNTFIFYSGEIIQNHTFYGFRQLSEIAVKALSPGINDPGTASTCLDYLTDLFAIRMDNRIVNTILDKEKVPRIFIHSYSFTELFNICLIPILNYGHGDITILQNLLVSLRKLAHKDSHKQYQKELNEFLKTLLFHIDQQKENLYFYNYLQVDIRKLKEVQSNYFFVL